MRHEDLEPAHHLRQRNRAIFGPVLHRFRTVDIHDKVLVLALEVDFRLGSSSASHCCIGFYGSSCRCWCGGKNAFNGDVVFFGGIVFEVAVCYDRAANGIEKELGCAWLERELFVLRHRGQLRVR